MYLECQKIRVSLSDFPLSQIICHRRLSGSGASEVSRPDHLPWIPFLQEWGRHRGLKAVKMWTYRAAKTPCILSQLQSNNPGRILMDGADPIPTSLLLPREAVEVSKTRQDGALTWDSGWHPCWWQAAWNRMVFNVPPTPNHAMTLYKGRTRMKERVSWNLKSNRFQVWTKTGFLHCLRKGSVQSTSSTKPNLTLILLPTWAHLKGKKASNFTCLYLGKKEEVAKKRKQVLVNQRKLFYFHTNPFINFLKEIFFC